MPSVARGVVAWRFRVGLLSSYLAPNTAYDFREFNEERFWGDYDRLQARHPDGWFDYRKEFDRLLAELGRSASVR